MMNMRENKCTNANGSKKSPLPEISVLPLTWLEKWKGMTVNLIRSFYMAGGVIMRFLGALKQLIRTLRNVYILSQLTKKEGQLMTQCGSSSTHGGCMGAGVVVTSIQTTSIKATISVSVCLSFLCCWLICTSEVLTLTLCVVICSLKQPLVCCDLCNPDQVKSMISQRNDTSPSTT
jgi:hypothetical protein